MTIDPARQLPGAAKTANDEFFDALVRHQIFVLRMAGGIRNDVIKLLNATEDAVVAAILARIKSGQPLTPNQLNRASKLAEDIFKIRGNAWNDAATLWGDTFKQFIVEEAAFVQGAVETVVPVILDTILPPPGQLRAIVTHEPFEGKVLSAWAKDAKQADIDRINDAVQIGLTQGESPKQIARRVVGTKALQGRDGITQTARRNIEAITRTATISYSNAGRRDFLIENDQFFDLEVYVATLDARTTPVCRGFDGERFTVGEGPQPPLHFNCRSLRVAILEDELIGSRPMKPTTERMLLREYTEQNGLDRVTSRAKLPRGHKGVFDVFARSRVRELIGRIPAKVTYGQWLATQTVEFQNEVLGPTRGKLFRNGGLTLDKFVNRAGDEIPLRQLSQRDAAAFRQAGLDPVSFN